MRVQLYREIRRILVAASFVLLAAPATAQTSYPEKTVRLLYGFPPGADVTEVMAVGRLVSTAQHNWYGPGRQNRRHHVRQRFELGEGRVWLQDYCPACKRVLRGQAYYQLMGKRFL